MNLILITGGSGGITLESFLAWLFPPRITSLDRDSLKDSLGYQYRITRRGVDKDPTAIMGAKVTRIWESRARSMPKSRGDWVSRRFSVCA